MHARGAFEIAETRGSAGTMTMRDSPFERAWGKKQITDQEYQAGIKFRHHWYHGGMAPKISSLNLDGVFARDLSMLGGMAKTEAQAFHRQKYREACEEMGQRACRAVEDAVCVEIEFEIIGRKFGYKNDPQARTCAVTLMQDGLYRLARLWGL